jgi:hypothetical protein
MPWSGFYTQFGVFAVPYKKNVAVALVKYDCVATKNVASVGLLLFACAATWAQPAPTRLTARDLGLVINTADPYSVAVGEYYAQRRGIPAEQVLRIAFAPIASTQRLAELCRQFTTVR